jgi:hypothetical protein
VSLEEFRATRQWSVDIDEYVGDLDTVGYLYDWGSRLVFVQYLTEGPSVGEHWTIMSSEDTIGSLEQCEEWLYDRLVEEQEAYDRHAGGTV